MITVTGLTAERMLAIEKASIVSGWVDGDELILQTHGGTEIVAGRVQGRRGFAGPTGTSFWVTRTPLSTSETNHVIPIEIPGQTVRVGDTIMSSHPETVGYFARVTSVSSQSNLTVTYLGSFGSGGGSVEPGTMVWHGDYDAWQYYRRGDMVQTDQGIFVGLAESVGEFPALPMDTFVDTFNRDEIGPEWQFNEGWVIENGRAANDPTSSGYKRLIKTNLTPDGEILITGFERATLNDAVGVYFGWLDENNYYCVVHGGHRTYVQQIVGGIATTLAETRHVLSTLPPIVVRKSGSRISVRMGQIITEAEADETINGSGWGIGYQQSNASGTTGFGTVASVEFTPAASPSWGVVSSPVSLSGLSDVLSAPPSHGDVLVYDRISERWIPTKVDGVEPNPGGGSGPSAAFLDDLLDVEVEDAEDGQTLTYDSDSNTWVPKDTLTEVEWKDIQDPPEIPQIIVSETEPENPTVGMIWVDLSKEGD